MKISDVGPEATKAPGLKTVDGKKVILHEELMQYLDDYPLNIVEHTPGGAVRTWAHYGIRGPGEMSVPEKASALRDWSMHLLKEVVREHQSKKRPRRLRPLHPETSAAVFLKLKREFAQLFNQNAAKGVELEAKLFAMCDAWHWLHMDRFEEHVNVLEGQASAKRQKKVAAANSSKAARKRAIVEAAILSLRPSKRNREQIVRGIMPKLRTDFAAAPDLDCPSHSTLLAWVGQLGRSAK
jgi:hypothetical protein